MALGRPAVSLYAARLEAAATPFVASTLPVARRRERTGGIYKRTTEGMRIYLATPRLRALLALNLAAAAAGAMVIVNTVVIVEAQMGRTQNDVAVALGCFGGGSMITSLLLLRVLERIADRTVMLVASAALGLLLLAFAAVAMGGVTTWPIMLAAWLVLGIGYSAAQTPCGRLLRRSAAPEDRPALFAAQFAFSHAAWLLTYPLAGWFGALVGIPWTLTILGIVTIVATATAAAIWPAADTEVKIVDDVCISMATCVGAAQVDMIDVEIVVQVINHGRWPARRFQAENGR